MDIIDFVEKECGCESLPWQKEALKKMQDIPHKDVESILEKDPHAFDRVNIITKEESLSVLQQKND